MVRSIPPTLRAGTPDLPDVPMLLHYLLLRYIQPILRWLETILLRRMLLACREHPLVQIALWYDPAQAVAACQGYYHALGERGATPTYSLDLLVRCEIVRSWANSCSDRELEWLLSSNLLIRWFVGLSLLDRVPDHSTLSRFHAWLSHNQPSSLFYDVLAFLDRLDPEDAATTPQILDTFALESPAAWVPRASNLLLDLCGDLLAAWQQLAPAPLQSLLPAFSLAPIALLARPRTAQERQILLCQSVSLSQSLLTSLTVALNALSPQARSSIKRLTDALAKVLSDEIEFDPAGRPTERKSKGDYRIISATDLEATFRKHDDDLTLGYNVALSTTSTRIRAVVVTTGATPDSETPALLAQQELAAQQPLPPYFIMDRAGGWGKCRARVDVLTEGQTAMVALTPSPGGADPGRFSLADFTIDPQRTICTCPNGVSSTKAYQAQDGDGVHFRFLASQCRGCPLWDKCRGPNGNPKGNRTVFVSDYYSYLRQAAAFNQSESGLTLLSQRWRVEPTIAWLTRYQGCRRARRVGVAAAQCQMFQACAVRNLLLWLSRIARGKARRPQAALASEESA